MGTYVLGCTEINQMMKFDRQEGINYKLTQNECIICSKMSIIYCSVDPVLVFEHL